MCGKILNYKQKIQQTHYISFKKNEHTVFSMLLDILSKVHEINTSYVT